MSKETVESKITSLLVLFCPGMADKIQLSVIPKTPTLHTEAKSPN
jgi:hypothetical protein